MNRICKPKGILRSLAAFVVVAFAFESVGQQKSIISYKDGALTYEADSKGNRVPDFSSCGYAGGDKAIPSAPVRVVVAPIKADETTRIQQAIDFVSSLPLDTNGLRGAVLLLKGKHQISGGLVITNSGVVLRGQGVGENDTSLIATGLDRRTLIRVFGINDQVVKTNEDWQIIDDYVPVGATSFHLQNANSLKPGTTIQITRPSTPGWVEKLNASEFGGGIGGGWKPGSRDVVWNRIIKSVEDNLVILDAPITTAIEKEVGGGSIQIHDWPGCIENVGIENLQLESTFDAKNAKDENHSWCAITMENTSDAWVRQVTFKHFAGSAVALYETCQRVTVQDCLSLEPVSEIGGYRRHTFFTMGQQTLFLRCYSEQGRHDFSVGHCAAGPSAFVQCEAREALSDSGPIESWGNGVLYDNVVIDGNALTLGFRPGNNAGIGWSAANCVLWNCSASVIRCWNPPGAQNWSFGSWASFEGNGIWRSSNDFMRPDSLFAAQLTERLGKKAADQLQLMPRPREESSNPPLDKAQELATASHTPPPLLKDYILAAARRISISDVPGDAPRIDKLPLQVPEVSTRHAKLTITNGWITVDGKVLIGSSENVTWWRGSIRPDEAPAFGLGITRFVPGRSGPGFTDDLNEVADALIEKDKVALDHNYGLWYDRRRDDHERVRRINGDVLPPFYEQPFARSGQGTAWLGLSKYDLTKFNPWYWSRLREFADICDQRGLVLFHQNYFQHNVLEAGAHWADSPWRTANNINNTGFPEPPPYAGDKRIFQAELFYDLTHPLRRKLHENYVRQCLANFATNSNVIQFTSAEYTGPLSFTEFWLDTVAKWERSHHRSKPIIALSATKDVQDAILADKKRRAIVDVVDFRYWWRTDKGDYAPPGGKNLAPRQFERQWRGGRPSDLNLASMAAEYRTKYPGKPLICDFDSASWAWLCAGGSMARLPRTTNSDLLATIPQMQPWPKFTGTNRWALSGAGNYLIYFGAKANPELDLSHDQGSFKVRKIDPKAGTSEDARTIVAGGRVELSKSSGPEIFWLRKE